MRTSDEALKNPTDEELEDALAGDVSSNPLYFHHEILGRGPLWAKQKELLLAPLTHHRITVKGGYNVGKTYTLAEIGVRFVVSEPNSILLTTAPTGRQVKKLLWGEIRRAVKQSKVKLGGDLLDLSWTFDDDWYAIGFSTDDPQNVQGFHARKVMVIIDEASGVDDEVIENLEGAVSGDGYLILSGNPLQAEGKFFDSFTDPDFHKITIPCLKHPNVVEGKDIFPGMVTREWCDRRLVRWGKDSPLYQARVEAMFPQGGSNLLIPIALAELAKENEIDVNPADPIEAGLDVSEHGGDETVFTVRQGPCVLHQEAWSHTELDETVGRTVRLIKDWKVKKIKTDRIGIGAGPTSNLKAKAKAKEINCEVIGVNVAETAYDTEQYQTRRDEVWFGLADRFKAKQVDLTRLKDSEELRSQVTTIRKSVNARGQQKAESKDDLKARGKQSPDRGDSLCLAFAHVRGAPVIKSIHTT